MTHGTTLGAACLFVTATLTLHSATRAAEPTGDVEALRRIEALQREGQQLYPHGKLEATIRTTDRWRNRLTGAEVVAYWDESVSRIEAQIVEETFSRSGGAGAIERKSSDMTIVTRGTEFLRFRESLLVVFVDDFGDSAFSHERSYDYLACLPRHCWFGGGAAVSRPWTFYFEPYVPREGYDRSTHVVTEGSLVRIRNVWTKDGAQVAETSGTFDLVLAGMCVEFERSSELGEFSGKMQWALDAQGRPVLQSYNWNERRRGETIKTSELTIRSFDPDVFVDEAKFSFDLAQFPIGTQVVDQRKKPWRIIWTRPDSTLDDPR